MSARSAALVFGSVLLSLLGCAAQRSDTAGGLRRVDRAKLRLTLAWDGDPADLSAILTVQNTGVKPLRVDSE
jgi:hypothetical protein